MNFYDLLLFLGDKIGGGWISKESHLSKSQWNESQKIIDSTNQKLQNIVRYASRKVPYYRNLFKTNEINPLEIKTTKDLLKIPILTRKMIKENQKLLLSEDIDKMKYKVEKTGGTSEGNPMSFLMDTRSRAWARARFYRQFIGYNIRERQKMLRYMDPIKFKHNAINSKIQDYLINQKWLIINSSDSKSLKLNKLNEIKSFNPKFIKGRPSSIFDLAKTCRDFGNFNFKFERIFTNGELLLPSQRKFIEDVFSSEIFDFYGCEGGISAFQCEEKTGYHVASDSGIFEIVNLHDDYKWEKDEKNIGRVIGTDLYNKAMPLIRYEVGDLVRPSNNVFCKCGRGLPLIKSPEGRKSNIINYRGKITTEKEIDVLLNRNFPIRLSSDILQLHTHKSSIELRFSPNSKIDENHKKEISKLIKDFLKLEVQISTKDLEIPKSFKRNLIFNH